MATRRCIPEQAGESSLTLQDEAVQSRLLREGEVVSCILTPVGSNYTFLAKLRDEDGRETRAIYKPMKGEIPLWDFESGTNVQAGVRGVSVQSDSGVGSSCRRR